jgi:hypothetical protein
MPTEGTDRTFRGASNPTVAGSIPAGRATRQHVGWALARSHARARAGDPQVFASAIYAPIGTRQGAGGAPPDSGDVCPVVTPTLGSRHDRAAPRPWGPGSDPDVGSYDVIHLGGQAAVVVPLSDFLKLRALEQRASTQEIEDAEDAAALQEWTAREARGQTSYVSMDEIRRAHSLSGRRTYDG